MFDKGVGYHQDGKLREARAIYETILTENPAHAGAIHLLGVVAHQSGQLAEAIALIDQALTLDFGCAEIHSNRGAILQHLNRNLEALASCDKAIALKSNYPEAHNNRGNALLNLGRLEEALESFAVAIALKPNFADAYCNLGNTLRDLNRSDEALTNYDKAIALDPGCATAHNNRGIVLLSNFGRFDEANRAHAKAVALSPHAIGIRANWLAAALPILYETPEEIRRTREDFSDRLQSLISLWNQKSSELGHDAANVGNKTFFYLPYQAKNDRSLQSKLGLLCCDIFGRLYRHAQDVSISKKPASLSRISGKVHIGIVSHYFRNHSNWKIPVKGWVEHINRERFILSAYYTDSIEDSETAIARSLFDSFVQETSIDGMCRILRADEPDVLIFPGVGMEKSSLHLAAQRFAPVQCASWGHPVTTGMPTIDYFLSSALMEPEQADAHYTEKLIRLPNLSISYSPPDVTPIKLSRAQFGLPDEALLFLCPQSLQKYLPQHDDLFVSIARQLPHAKFVLLSYGKSQAVAGQLRTRMNRSFAILGDAGEERIIVLPALSAAEFRAMSQIADICLDTPDWSGCNSSLELLAGGLPVVTLPGEFMRGRHTYAILKMMGLPELIADSPKAYVSARVKKYPAVRVEIYPGTLAACH